MHIPLTGAGFDPLPEIVSIVRDAIKDGLIDEPLETFEQELRLRSGTELEDYIQTTWDKI